VNADITGVFLMESSGKRRKSLTRLRKLVNQLSDRDDQLKKDMRLFQKFFETFPIPVTMWSISADGMILSKRGNGFIAHEASDLHELFPCPDIANTSIEKHEEALAGKQVDYFAKSGACVFYVKLLPRLDDAGNVAGVTGISWDVTSNAIMLSCLEDIATISDKRRGDYKQINTKAVYALETSRLRKLLSARGENDG
tara:strand:- start:529 stop:1119 length:591 start_codon:yes stop_codon:yes gene_type:complete